MSGQRQLQPQLKPLNIRVTGSNSSVNRNTDEKNFIGIFITVYLYLIKGSEEMIMLYSSIFHIYELKSILNASLINLCHKTKTFCYRKSLKIGNLRYKVTVES